MTARPQDVALLPCPFPPAAFEEWFAAVEAGDGSIPIPQSIADGEAWHAYIGRRQIALGAWLAATDAALASAQAREEELRAERDRAVEAGQIMARRLDALEGRAERLAEALRRGAKWGLTSRGYCSSVATALSDWVEAGMTGDLPPIPPHIAALTTNAAQPGETNG